MITTTCQTCNDEFQAREQDLKRGLAKYCSRKCAGIARSTKPKTQREPNLICAYCSKSFYRSPSKLSKSKSKLYFCCREHKDLAQSLDGLQELHPTHYGKGTNHTTYRLVAFRQYAKKCQDCGFDAFPEVLEVHHIDRNRKNNTPENLKVLCPTCHRIDHFKAKDGRWSKST